MRSNNLSKLANQINQNSQMKMHNEQYDTNLEIENNVMNFFAIILLKIVFRQLHVPSDIVADLEIASTCSIS